VNQIVLLEATVTSFGAFSFFAVVPVGDDDDRTVKLGAGDAPVAVLAGDQASFPIDGIAIRIHRRLAKDPDAAVVLAVTNDALLGMLLNNR
jgi:hypothetical protein